MVGVFAGATLSINTQRGVLLGVALWNGAFSFRTKLGATGAVLCFLALWGGRNLADGLSPIFPYSGWSESFQSLEKYGVGRGGKSCCCCHGTFWFITGLTTIDFGKPSSDVDKLFRFLYPHTSSFVVCCFVWLAVFHSRSTGYILLVPMLPLAACASWRRLHTVGYGCAGLDVGLAEQLGACCRRGWSWVRSVFHKNSS